uniref:Uncharacterized protein n=1 Tax=viral metagenome TaxID=1070528 RepID=A0A6M3JRH0_9ZZZZ
MLPITVNEADWREVALEYARENVILKVRLAAVVRAKVEAGETETTSPDLPTEDPVEGED